MLMHLCNKDPLALETVQCSMARILTRPGFNAASFIECLSLFGLPCQGREMISGFR